MQKTITKPMLFHASKPIQPSWYTSIIPPVFSLLWLFLLIGLVAMTISRVI